MTQDWQAFVRDYGFQVRSHHLAAVVGQPVDAIGRFRAGAGKCRRGRRRAFAELFQLYHGRAPRDAEWPIPRRLGGSYEWLGPELALLGSLVGRYGTPQIAAILTTRLRAITNDPAAVRDRQDVTSAMHDVGLQATDVLGGLTVPQAAARVGVTTTLIHQAIYRKELKAGRVGRLLVITPADVDAWKAKRLPDPPKGWIKLWDIRHQLGFSGVGEGLSWKARKGLIPRALFCAGWRWWVPPAVAKDLLRRKKLGLPMPWRGHVEPGVARRSYDLWRSRRHARCAQCAAIWKTAGGVPTTFDVFYQRWIPIPETDKRHLTAPDGISATRAADRFGVERHTITHAIVNRILPATRCGAKYVIRHADLQRWLRRSKALSTNTGVAKLHHQPLTLKHAASRARIPLSAVYAAIRAGEVATVRRHDGRPGLRPRDVMRLRTTHGGLTIAEGARRCQVAVATFLTDARMYGWRDGDSLTVAFVKALMKRRQATWQLTFEQAATRLGVDVAWIQRAIDQGYLSILRGVDARERRVGRKAVDAMKRSGLPTLTEPSATKGWCLLFEAAAIAGVSITTVIRWRTLGQITTKPAPRGLYYSERSICRAARTYWASRPGARRPPPAWLQAERSAAA